MTEAGATRVRRARSRSVSPSAFRRVALLALASLFLVVVTGAVVRLTASGLGCENWPRCGDAPFPEREFHALVEFGNRVVALFALGTATLAALVARRVPGLPRRTARGALAVAVAVVAQIPLGGLTVIFELHPLLVMSHFLLALAAVGLAVAVVLGAHDFAAGPPVFVCSRVCSWLALALVPVALVLVVTGAFTTAAGPHSGGADIERLGNLEQSVYVHVRASALFGVGFLLLVLALFRERPRSRRELRVATVTLALLLVQMAVCEIQWRNELPWALLLVHVTLATGVWSGVVALAVLLRPRSGPASIRSSRPAAASPS